MNVPLSIDESHYRALIYLALDGDIDLASIATIRDRVVDRLRSKATTELVIDVDAVSSIDTAGVGLLVAWQDLAADAGIPYRVVNAHGRIRKVMDRAGVADAEADIPGGPAIAEPQQPARSNTALALT